MHTTQIEQQLTLLFRRVQRIHTTTSDGEVVLDRAGYGILCRLVDEGPQRLGALAHAFQLDPSTITRQVQTLEQSGLAQRRPDPTDRRASLLDATEEGTRVLTETRQRRRRWLAELLEQWPESERAAFGRLLEKFNDSVDALVQDIEEQRRADQRRPDPRGPDQHG